MHILKYISRQFGNPSVIGGRISTLIMNIINQRMYRSCLELIEYHNPASLLDVGFGNGYMLSRISKKSTLN